MKEYRKSLILSSLLTLLPIAVGLLLWDRFPAQMAVHWGLDGQPDGWAAPLIAIVGLPVMMAALNVLCMLLTWKDPGNQGRNRKPLKLVLWIVPVISNLCSYLMYGLALGMDFSVSNIMVGAMGLMFAVIGNFMPKMKQNSTMGIKIPWTYSSEENWNATHRFAGKLWVVGGIVIALSALLPDNWGMTVMLVGLLALAVIPSVYSYRYYKRQKAEGSSVPLPKMSKGAYAALALLLIFMAVILFTGDVEYEFQDRGFIIEGDYYNNYSVLYEDIRSVELREDNVPGVRVGGFGSLRLLMGYFQNEEFGTYVRYTYYKPESCVVLKTDSKTIVLSGVNAESTRSLYAELLERTSK